MDPSLRPKLTQFKKEEAKTTGTASRPSEQQLTFPFVQLMFKPQSGAVAPFKTNEPTRQPETRSTS
jgi:hypothetical protein